MVRVYLVRHRQVTRSGILLALFVLALLLTIQARGIQRRVLGVKSGVTLEGQEVGGLLPAELARVVRRIATGRERHSRNAMYFPETGEVVPEQDGVCVDVAGTVRAVCSAGPRANVGLVTRTLPAAVTKEHFTPIFRGSPDRPEVALAINVAWGEESLPGVLDALRRESVHASFFFVGDWARTFPELVQATARAGHEIGNHGLHHSHPRSLSRPELSRLILENTSLLRGIIGRPPAALFAPPAGEFDERTIGVATELGYRTVLWTVDTVDWKRPSPDLILARVVNNVSNGAIILMHPTAPTLTILPRVIQTLRERGYSLVTVGELLRGSGA